MPENTKEIESNLRQTETRIYKTFGELLQLDELTRRDVYNHSLDNLHIDKYVSPELFLNLRKRFMKTFGSK